MSNKVLIVEDEIKISRFLELELKHEGYEVETAFDGIDGYEKGKKDDIDLILLDIMLPSLSGIEVCRRLRQCIQTPIIMLTAKDDVSDKVTGLDSGADDYMTKPFAIEELLARIRVALKRKKNQNTINNQDCLEYKGLLLNKKSHEVKFKTQNISLTKKEHELLQYLLENRGQVLTRDQIIENVWGYDYYGETNTVDVYIRYLRSKIDQKFCVKIIDTVRGIGYIIPLGDNLF